MLYPTLPLYITQSPSLSSLIFIDTECSCIQSCSGEYWKQKMIRLWEFGNKVWKMWWRKVYHVQVRNTLLLSCTLLHVMEGLVSMYWCFLEWFSFVLESLIYVPGSLFRREGWLQGGLLANFKYWVNTFFLKRSCFHFSGGPSQDFCSCNQYLDKKNIKIRYKTLNFVVLILVLLHFWTIICFPVGPMRLLFLILCWKFCHLCLSQTTFASYLYCKGSINST